MPTRTLRLADNEAHFRSANEGIERTARETMATDELIPFLCECPDSDCQGRPLLTVIEYERIRSDPAQFIVIPGHERPALEDVAERHARYVVVRKQGDYHG